jgi:superfamily II DNA or RNA helicase
MADMVILDEAHVRFKLYERWVDLPQWQKIPFVGLTATPWSKGMGKIFDDLIIGVTMQELIDQGHLSDFRVYAPAHPDLSGVKTVLGDYEIKGLGSAMNKNALVADIVSTWMERGEGRSTICFAVNRVHAKHIQTQFIDAGVSAEYMDAYTDLEDRSDIIRRFENGDVQVICNVGVLTTGFDSDVRCIVLARPTKSEILYVQMIGRGLRTADGKDDCLILDHSDTTLRLGFVTDIGTDKLHDGTANRQAVEKKAPLPKECPSCSFLKPPKSRKCPACGFEAVAKSEVQNEDGELREITRAKKVTGRTFSGARPRCRHARAPSPRRQTSRFRERDSN